VQDSWGRKINYARISITERCNISCVYCRPERVRAQGNDPLSLSDLLRLVRVLIGLGINRIKLTGGEPTLREDLLDLVAAIKSLPGLVNVTLTTNGLRLAQLAAPLAAAGLDSVNVSLDSMNREEFRQITRGGDINLVINGLSAALAAKLPGVKVNCVPTAGTTEAELISVAELARKDRIHVRYIEIMPMGLGKDQAFLSNNQVKEILGRTLGPLTPLNKTMGNGPASYFSAPGFTGGLGFISAMSSCFCERCNRLRITADGHLKTCLHLDAGLPLPLGDDQALAEAIRQAILAKPARHLFGENPLGQDRRPMYQIGG
jgi:cyclic pyranopterin phosphate synthase